MKKLVIDTDVLRSLAEQLAVIGTEFVFEDDAASELSVAVGSEELGNTILQFATDWSIRRAHFVQDITVLETSLGLVARALEGLDNDLAVDITTYLTGIDWRFTNS